MKIIIFARDTKTLCKQLSYIHIQAFCYFIEMFYVKPLALLAVFGIHIKRDGSESNSIGHLHLSDIALFAKSSDV